MGDNTNACSQALAGPHRPNWSIIASAPSTSQVIGVLAAIIFGAVILLLQAAPNPGDSTRYQQSVKALRLLIFVFFTLIIAAFLFSVLGGEQLCRRAFAAGAFASALFALAGVATFLCICWLFAAYHIGDEQVIWPKLMLVATMLTAWTHMTLTLFLALEVTDPHQLDRFRSGIMLWGMGLFLLPATVGALASWVPDVRKWLKKRDEGLFKWTAGASIVAALSAITGFSWIGIQEPEPLAFPLALRFGIMGGTGAAVRALPCQHGGDRARCTSIKQLTRLQPSAGAGAAVLGANAGNR